MRRNLQRLQLGVQGEPHVGNLQRWSYLIEHGDLSGIRRIMTGVDVDSCQMREVSPMGGLLSQEKGDLALDAVGR